MAKQGKAIIEKRKAELAGYGYTEQDMTPDIIEAIEYTAAGNWKGISEGYKKKKEEAAIPFTEAEHITEEPDANPGQMLIPTMDSAKDIKALRDNPLVKAIANFEKEYKGLTFKGLDDKTGIEKVKAAKRTVQKTRTWIEKTEATLKAPYIRGSKDIKAVADELRAMIAPVEDPLDAEMERLKQLQQEDEERKAQEAEKEGIRRVEVLKEAGIRFGGMFYEIGETISVDYGSIKAMPIEEFDKFVAKVCAEKSRLDAIEEEKAATVKRERLSTRGGMLLSLGMTYADIQGRGVYSSEHLEGVSVFVDTLTDEEDGVFMRLFESLSSRITTAKVKADEEKKRQAKETTVKLRSKLLIAVGMDRVDWIPGTTQPGFYFKNAYVECKMELPKVENLTHDEFDHMLDVMEKEINDAKALAVKKEEEDKAAELLSSARSQQLIALGMTRAPRVNRFIFNLPDVEGECSVDYSELMQSPEEWAATITDVTANIDMIKKNQQAFEDKAAADKKTAEEKAAKDAAIFQERQYKLVNLGMVIVGAAFVLKNEFGAVAAIDIEEIKALDEDIWPRRLLEITKAVDAVKKHTEEKRQAKIAEAEALKPEVQRIKEYFESVLNIPLPQVSNGDLVVILSEFQLGLTTVMEKAVGKLQAIEKK